MLVIFSPIWLQEVDRFDDLADLLKKDGFGGVYKVCWVTASIEFVDIRLNWLVFLFHFRLEQVKQMMDVPYSGKMIGKLHFFLVCSLLI